MIQSKYGISIDQTCHMMKNTIQEYWGKQIFLNGIFHDVIYLVNNNAIFTLNNANVKDFLFLAFLEGIVKESVKLLCYYFKADDVLCFHEDVICFNSKELLLAIL